MQRGLEIEIQVHEHYLYVIHTGVINDMEVALQCFSTSLEQAQSNQKNGILADLTRVEYSPLSAIDRILYFQSAIEIYQRYLTLSASKIKLAILQTPQAENNYTPGIDTAIESGMDCKIFYARPAALNWLEQASH